MTFSENLFPVKQIQNDNGGRLSLARILRPYRVTSRYYLAKVDEL